MKYISLARMSW